MTQIPLYQVDAFTGEPFKGNPDGVCILKKAADAEWMQNIAMEMNLSETAFVFPEESSFNIRFFTPAAEIELCGHATLSTAHILYETGIENSPEEISFSSKAGILKVKKDKNLITMNFPAYPLKKMDIPFDFEKITGIKADELYRTGHGWTLALVKNEEELKNITPNLHGMKNSEFGDMIVTSTSSDRQFDFCVRCFVPALGIDEDPVTGSAHCSLTPYWNAKTGKSEFVSHQVSKRGGILKVSLKGERVEISGEAVTIFKAELFV
jgi:PhzF family phenazine biosynthesis protein